MSEQIKDPLALSESPVLAEHLVEISEMPTEASIYRDRRSDGLQYPTTIAPLFVAAIAVMFLIIGIPGLSVIGLLVVTVVMFTARLKLFCLALLLTRRRGSCGSRA